MVTRPMLGRSTSITVDNYPVATVPKATLENPWVETAFPQAEPKQLVVIQVQPEPARFGILVFVDGVCLQGGGSLQDWRARKPAPQDRFEQVIRPDVMWGAKTAAFLGAFGVLPTPLFVAWMPASPTYWLLLACGFAIPAGWWLLVGRLVLWLRTRRTWPWRLRVMSVPTVLLGVPVLVILSLQAVTGTH